MTKPETVFLVGFFKFDDRGGEYGFKRLDLHGIYRSAEEAREKLSFCDEAGWYEGALIEERAYGHQDQPFRGKREWLFQKPDGSLQEGDEPGYMHNVFNLIG